MSDETNRSDQHLLMLSVLLADLYKMTGEGVRITGILYEMTTHYRSVTNGGQDVDEEMRQNWDMMDELHACYTRALEIMNSMYQQGRAISEQRGITDEDRERQYIEQLADLVHVIARKMGMTWEELMNGDSDPNENLD